MDAPTTILVDGSGTMQTLESAVEIARELQQRIGDVHGLGASIGVGTNKLIAKMASGVKKPRGITALNEESFRGVFWPQDVQALWGVGPKMSEHLKALVSPPWARSRRLPGRSWSSASAWWAST